MKKLISLTLVIIMLSAALASCAAAPKATAAISANIRVTSSDALDAATWLTERLGDKLTSRVVLGIDGEAYGVDVSSLEADGYIVRDLGGETALFARTSDGLDRAARKYAKMVESDAVADVTYHEGYRVKRVELAGRDISEYTVYAGDETLLLSAAKEFASYIKTACGAEVAVSTGTPAAPYIVLGFVHDETLSSCGYRWNVTDKGLTFECSDAY